MNRNARINNITVSVDRFCQLIEKQAGRIIAPAHIVNDVLNWIESSYYTKALKNYDAAKHLAGEDLVAMKSRAKSEMATIGNIIFTVKNREDDYEKAMRELLYLVKDTSLNTLKIKDDGDGEGDIALSKDGSSLHFSLHHMDKNLFYCRIATDYLDSKNDEEFEGNLVETLFFIKKHLRTMQSISELLQEGSDNLDSQGSLDPSMLEFVKSKAQGEGTKTFKLTTDDMGMTDRLHWEEMEFDARLEIERDANHRGYWDEGDKKGSFLGTIVILVNDAMYPSKDTDLVSMFETIRSTIRHELEHTMGSALVFLTGEEQAGQPKKRIRDRRYDELGYRNEEVKDTGKEVINEYGEGRRQDHALRDTEFFTRLGDEIEKFQKVIKDIPEELRKDFARVYIGEEDRFYFKGLALEYTKKTGENVNFFYAYSSDFFRKLLTYQEDKWKVAIKEFYKAVEPSLHTSASILEEAQSFEKLAGVLEPPPGLVENVMSWVESAIAHQIVKKSREANNDETISRIAWARVDLLEALINVIQQPFERQKFAEQIDALFVDESLWFPGITKYENDLIRLELTNQQYEVNVSKDTNKYRASFFHGETYVSGYDDYDSLEHLHKYLSSILDKLKMLFELIHHGINDINYIDYYDNQYPPLADELDTLSAEDNQGAVFTIDSNLIPVKNNQSGEKELEFAVKLQLSTGDILGTWQANSKPGPLLGVLRIGYNFNLDVKTNEELEKYLEGIRDTVIHELIHMMQTGIKYLGNLPEEGGLPGQNIRDNKKQTGYDHLGNPLYPVQNFQRQTHALRDIEFQTRLSDSIRSFNSFKSKIPTELQKVVAKYFVGEAPEKTMNDILFKYMAKNPDKEEPMIPYSADHFFTSLREAQPLKYEKAVKEFYKAVSL